MCISWQIFLSSDSVRNTRASQNLPVTGTLFAFILIMISCLMMADLSVIVIRSSYYILSRCTSLFSSIFSVIRDLRKLPIWISISQNSLCCTLNYYAISEIILFTLYFRNVWCYELFWKYSKISMYIRRFLSSMRSSFLKITELFCLLSE